jgi:galactokinase
MPASSDRPLQLASRLFKSRFGNKPAAIASAPGRVELLGNHTDYNGGLVIAAAIDRTTVCVGRRQGGREARVASVHFDDLDTFSLDAIEPTEPGTWARYARGVCWALNQWRGPLSSGFEAVIAGDVPLGAGLSSSASLQASFASLLIELGIVPEASSSDFATERGDPFRMELAQVLRRSENEFVGVGSGLLDQFSSLFGRDGCALFLNCRTLDFERLTLGGPAPAIVVCDSRTSRRLADGMYNQRRAECERVLSAFRTDCPGDGELLLSQLSLAQLESKWQHLDPIGRKRARHVLTENDRVRRGTECLRSGSIETFGTLMSASHASSRDDFENSSEALDALIEVAATAPGFLGGKLSGAGWAGCTVNLVRAEYAADFSQAIARGYLERTGISPEIHVCHATDGATARNVAPLLS